MAKARFITAIGTPLTEDDQLHTEGLAQHIEDQAAAGIDSLLVAGTMGMMPLQTDATWKQLLKRSIELARGRFEMLVGATDVSTSRALDRIEYVNSLDGIDGTVVMAPGLFKFTEPQYIDYFTDLANASRYPIYLYDLQPVTGVHLSVQTMCKLSEHPNIAGVKLSANVPEMVRLKLNLGDTPFRLIVAEPVLSDMLFRSGYEEHLDGIYVFCPHWAKALADAAEREDWEEAARWQAKLTRIKEMFINLPMAASFTGMMNLRGIEGKYMPKPFPSLSPEDLELIRSQPIVQELLASTPAEA